jgi:predicted Zn-dependent protease
MLTDNEYFNTKEFKKILYEYENKVKSGQPIYMDVDDLTDIADYYHLNFDNQKAEDAIGLALEIQPGATLPLVYKARQALENENSAKAEHFLNQIEDKEDPDYQYLKAEIMIAKDKINEANNYLLQCYSDLTSEDEQNDFTIDVSNLYADYQVSDRLQEWLLKYKGEITDDIKELQGRDCFLNQQYEKSEKIFNELVESKPYNKQYWSSLASAQYLADKFSDCITSSEFALAIDPNNKDALQLKGNSLQRLGNYEGALACYSSYCAICPMDSFILLQMAVCQNELHKPEEAIKTLETAYEFGASDEDYRAQVLEEMTFVYLDMKNFDKALECIRQTKELECDHINMMVIEGHILNAAKRNKEAEKIFLDALSQSKDPAHTMLRIIISIYDNGDITLCYNLLHLFFKEVSDSFTDGYAYMALCCFELEKRTECLNYLHDAIELNPNEVKLVFSKTIPPEIPLSGYYKYIENKFNQKSIEP